MITPAAFSVFITNINTMVGEAYGTTPTQFQEFATTIPTTTTVWEAGWTGMLDKMRVWSGPRVTHQPAPQTYQVTVLPYELTEEIDRFHLDDDKFGIYYRLLPDMARQAKRWPDYEIRDLLENAGAQTGTRQNGFDGLTAFNTAHPVDLYDSSKGTYSNDFTGGGMNVTYPKPGGGTSTVLTGGAFSPTAFATLTEYMMTLKAEDNEAMGIRPNLLMVAPQLMLEAELVLKSMFFAPPSWGSISSQVGAADNPLKRFGVETLVNPLLKDATTWYLFDTTKALKPLLWILRGSPVFTPRVNEDDPVVFDRHVYQYGVWGRATPAWNFSWLFARSGP